MEAGERRYPSLTKVRDAGGLCLDLVGHSEEAAHLGDESWRDLLAIERLRRVVGELRRSAEGRGERPGPLRTVGWPLFGHDLVRHSESQEEEEGVADGF